MHGFSPRRLFEQHLCVVTYVSLVESMKLPVAHVEQKLAAALLLLLVNGIGYAQGRRARSLAVRKDMKLCDVEPVEKPVTLVKKLRLLAPAPHHHVYPDKGIGNLLLYKLYLVGEERLVVTSVHEAQHLVGTALKRDVEMGHEGSA